MSKQRNDSVSCGPSRDDEPVHDDFPHEELFSEWDGPPVRDKLHGSARSRRKMRDDYDAGRAW